MPTIELSNPQLAMVSIAVKTALDADQHLGLLAAEGLAEYEPMTGAARREMSRVLAVVDAVAKEHA